jgi:hypothetical protein
MNAHQRRKQRRRWAREARASAEAWRAAHPGEEGPPWVYRKDPILLAPGSTFTQVVRMSELSYWPPKTAPNRNDP